MQNQCKPRPVAFPLTQEGNQPGDHILIGLPVIEEANLGYWGKSDGNRKEKRVTIPVRPVGWNFLLILWGTLSELRPPLLSPVGKPLSGAFNVMLRNPMQRVCRIMAWTIICQSAAQAARKYTEE
jgi:hypothetical protein